MNWKIRVCCAVLAMGCLGALAGCNKTDDKTKPATKSAAPGPARANTTDSK